MRKKENKYIITPLFLLFALVMFVMAFISIKYSLTSFLVELVLAITATVLVIVSIINLKNLISMVLTGAAKRLFRDESRTIDDIMIPVVIISRENEIMAANALFKENVCNNEDPLGDSIDKYLSDENTDAIFASNGADTRYNDKWYIVFAVRHEYGSIVYFIDDNTYKTNSDEYLQSRPVVAIVAFDNKDELERETDNSEAIYHHDDKYAVDAPMDEVLKDADVIHHCMNDLSKKVKDKEKARYASLCEEFGM